MRWTALVAIVLTVPALAFAHGGGIDKCGGHRDKKRGGYHVHQHAKYCGCHPDAPECKVNKSKKK
jgi:hypothetical protein